MAEDARGPYNPDWMGRINKILSRIKKNDRENRDQDKREFGNGRIGSSPRILDRERKGDIAH
jgi:hypothetical protein